MSAEPKMKTIRVREMPKERTFALLTEHDVLSLIKDADTCPFCGSPLLTIMLGRVGTANVRCCECSCEGPMVSFHAHQNNVGPAAKEAVKRWNDRVEGAGDG